MSYFKYIAIFFILFILSNNLRAQKVTSSLMSPSNILQELSMKNPFSDSLAQRDYIVFQPDYSSDFASLTILKEGIIDSAKYERNGHAFILRINKYDFKYFVVLCHGVQLEVADKSITNYSGKNTYSIYSCLGNDSQKMSLEYDALTTLFFDKLLDKVTDSNNCLSFISRIKISYCLDIVKYQIAR